MVSPNKIEYQIQQACLRFIQRLGDKAVHPLIFKTLAEIADKNFNLKMDGANPDDICFIGKPDKFVDDKLYRRMVNNKGKVYYVVEGQGHSPDEQGEA